MTLPLLAEGAVLRTAARLASAMVRYHGATLDGAHHLPAGPALLVGNHGLLGLDTPVLFSLLHTATGRFPFGLADRFLFSSWPVRSILASIGGVPGTRENALLLLRRGEHVVCYPGGSREVFKAPDARYQLAWERAVGFAHVAIEAGVPVLPFAGLGVDDTCVNLGHAQLLRGLGRYAPPLAFGPFPVRLRFRLGEPLVPPRSLSQAQAFKELVQKRVEALLEDRAEAASQPAPVVP